MIMDLYALMKSVWTVWFFVLFVGILFWVFRPGSRAAMNKHAMIPLEDAPDTRRTGV
jgi:cytochrome c oxidase cbb3-type subunit 4